VVDDQRTALVLTHGELHPGNIMRTSRGLALLDWDTVALARPERDLWMLAEADPTLVTRYEALTGAVLDADALAAHRLLWALDDLAAFTAQLRRPHGPDPDAERAITAVRDILSRREPSPYGATTAR
jgi:spectinomycin phosphotransferase